MKEKIHITVMIPTFRREAELVHAINSVLKISELNIEVLVADDSPEGTAEPFVAAISDNRVHYEKRSHPTGGIPAIVRNDLAQKARGDVFYFLDDDDTIEPQTLVEMYRKLMSSSAGVAIAAVHPMGDENSEVVQHERDHYRFARTRFQTYLSRYQFFSRMLNNMPLMVCSAGIVKKEVFHRIGGFDARIPLFEDIDFYLRAARDSDYIYVDRILLNRKTGGSSLVQDAKNDTRIQDSYVMMSENYKKKYGVTEWAILKLMNYLKFV